MARDEWKEVWDWARKVWGVPENDTHHSTAEGRAFDVFFHQIASARAHAEQWEELGSSDVWHASYHTVKYIKEHNLATDKQSLMQQVRRVGGYSEWS